MSIAPAQSVAKTSRLPNSGERASTVRRRLPFGGLWLSACLLLASWLGFGGLNSPPPADELASPSPAASTAEVAAIEQSPRARAIEEIRVGDRVAGKNPELTEADRAIPEPDPAACGHLKLRMRKPDGGAVDIELLRPLDWIDELGAAVGGTIELDMPELGVQGPAEVLSLDSCPPLKSGTGQLVTGTFAHTSANVIDLHIEGLAAPIGCTANHPFWSEDRQQFIPAGQLQPGEQVRTLNGLAQATAITPRAGRSQVHNLEVHGEHVYLVTSSGVLVHNTCAGLHHFVLRALGSKVPYGSSSLTHLNAFRHTKLHRRLTEHLNLSAYTKVYRGRTITMDPQRWGGKTVRAAFSKEERYLALDDFYRTYNNGEYYKAFQIEFLDTLAKGLFK